MWNSLKSWSNFNSFLCCVNIVHVQENGIYFFIPNFIYHISWIVRQRTWSYSVSFLQIILVYCVYFHFFFQIILLYCVYFHLLFFHFVKLRNLRFHSIFLTKKLSTLKLLFDLIIFFVVIPMWAKVHPGYEYDSQWFKNKIKFFLEWEENISEKI